MNLRHFVLIALTAALCWNGRALAEEPGSATSKGATESESAEPADKKPAEKPEEKKLPPPVKIQNPGPLMTGPMPKEIIKRVIRRNIKQVQFCYERSLVTSPKLAGKVVVKFSIGPTGAVTNASVSKTTLNNQTVEDCIVKKILRWKFPQPEGGGEVNVNYPFVFQVVD